MKKQFLTYFAYALIGLALSSPLAAAPATQDTKPAQPLVVVELFTSQGCSSCPPADRFLATLAKRDDVLALSLPVTYWDYLGWKDTLGREAHTKRQQKYARQLGAHQIYTPQIVVDGWTDAIGSRDAEVLGLINQRRDRDQDRLARPVVTLSPGQASNDMHLTISADARYHRHTADIVLVRFDPRHIVDVGRGENAGRALTYSNVVRDMKVIGTYDGTAQTHSLAMLDQWMDGSQGCAILVQDRRTGRIIGATYTIL